jgi:Zn-dependent peptidase ImmA (M78 family)
LRSSSIASREDEMGEKVFSFGIVLQCLWRIWEPAGTALNVRHALGVRSLEDTTPALERAGYEICFVDLPDQVSGFAAIIAHKPNIVLNRAKSQQELEFTLPHELGHHTLHLNPVRDYGPHVSPDLGNAEFEADLFAMSWLLFLGKDKQRKSMLLQNPEILGTLVSCLFVSVVFLLCACLMSFMLPEIPETK